MIKFLKNLFAKKEEKVEEKEELFPVYFYHFLQEEKAIKYMLKSKRSEVLLKAHAIKDFLNYCIKSDYMNGKINIEDCLPYHFHVENYPIGGRFIPFSEIISCNNEDWVLKAINKEHEDFRTDAKIAKMERAKRIKEMNTRIQSVQT